MQHALVLFQIHTVSALWYRLLNRLKYGCFNMSRQDKALEISFQGFAIQISPVTIFCSTGNRIWFSVPSIS